jgi:regulator of protease activity HflC (stomatin/prohibitin superfamily)
VILAKIFSILLGLVAVENLISLILEIYRPRLKGQVTRILYESRLIGLLGQPGGLITTAAQALDYQFGFKVSETWFYQFLERSIAWLILLQLGLLFISTSVVMIQPQEQALLERFGHPVKGREVLDPGIHFKWPWPIDKAYVFSSKKIHTFFVGYTPDETAKEKALTWTRKHHKEEFSMIVANRDQETFSPGATNAPNERVVPVNLLAINIPVQYRIVDLKKWAVLHAKAPEILENIANREVVRYLINVDIEELMTTGRLSAADILQKEINSQAAKSELGVEVVYLGFQSVHPPVQVAADYEKVIGAIQEKQTNLLGSQAYWAERIPQAIAESTNLLSVATQQSITKVALAEAQSIQFSNQLTAFLASPSVYKRRAYLETLVQESTKARKYIITATNTEDVILLNLEDKLRDDMENLQIPPAR